MTLVANGFVLQNGTPYLAQIPQPTYIQMPGACLCAPSSFTKLKKYVFVYVLSAWMSAHHMLTCGFWRSEGQMKMGR